MDLKAISGLVDGRSKIVTQIKYETEARTIERIHKKMLKIVVIVENRKTFVGIETMHNVVLKKSQSLFSSKY